MRRNITVLAISVVILAVISDEKSDETTLEKRLFFNQTAEPNVTSRNYVKFRRKRGAIGNVTSYKNKISRCKRGYGYNYPYQYCGGCRYTYVPRCQYVPPPYVIPPPYRQCNCDPDGSEFLVCNQEGQCRCREHFTGKKCDTCEDGCWREDSRTCKLCNCNPNGSVSNVCNKQTGSCQCKPGIGNVRCDQCLPDFYGTIATGCKACDPCKKDGHICDPNNGRCVCPPLTTDDKCNKCQPNSWGYEPGLGCKACECSPTGTHKSCDLHTGVCTCKPGYEGSKCNRCAPGFHGYPHCKECDCDPNGSASTSCNTKTGKCSCKENVEGHNCSKCKPGTFGLSKNNKEGCSHCFCFGRTKKCSESKLKWKQIMSGSLRESTSCVVAQNCIELPAEFLGDLTKSYGGNFYVTSTNRNFTVYMRGHKGVVLAAQLRSKDLPIVMTEEHWNVFRDPLQLFPSKQLIDPNRTCTTKKGCFLSVLQKITNITIEARVEIKSVSFQEVSLDTASEEYGVEPAHSVEKCDCPKEYTSLSCQDPNQGYYRHFPGMNEPKVIYDKIVGVAKACQCNGMSKVCDQESGHCLNCGFNRTGAHCENCKEGFYEHFGVCSPCLCPSEDKHFASKCTPIVNSNNFVCTCKPEYTGVNCNECAHGYYGEPQKPSGFCQKCNCHPNGSKDVNACSKFSGKCICNPGFTGQTCNRCSNPREVIEDGFCVPCDECSQNLFRQIDELSANIETTSGLFKDGLGPPWKLLNENLDKYNERSEEFEERMEKSERLIRKAKIKDYENIISDLESAVNKNKRKVEEHLTNVKSIRNGVEKINDELDEIQENVFSVVGNLSSFGKSKVDIRSALNEAQIILNNITNISAHAKSERDYLKVFNDCRAVSAEVDKVYKNSSVNLSGEVVTLKEFRRKLSDLNALLENIDNMNKLTAKKNSQIAGKLGVVQRKIDEINGRNEGTEKEIVDVLREINGTREVLAKITDIQDYLTGNIDVIDNEIAKVDQNNGDLDPKLRNLLDKVEEHVQELKNKVKRLEDFKKNMFNYTMHSKNVEAIMSHKTVAKNIRKAYEDAMEARKIVEEASKKINNSVNGGGDPLSDKTNIALGVSDRLEKRIRNILNQREDYFKTVTQLSDLKGHILDNGKFNNQLNTKLRNIQEELNKFNDKDMKKIILNDVSDKMNKLQEKMKNMKFVDSHTFYKDFQKYKQLTTPDEINNLRNKIVKTRVELDKYILSSGKKHLYETFKDKQEKIVETGKSLENIRKKIDQLKSSIEYAKHEANAIDIPLNLTNCTQFYKVGRQLFSSFEIVFTCENECTLFSYKNETDFLTLKVSNKKIQFAVSFNGKNGTRHFDYDGTKLANVKIEWTLGRVIFTKDSTPKVIDLGEKSTLFVLDNMKAIQIGPSNSDNSCVQRAFLNGKVFGFWNFHHFEGTCGGCDKDRTVETLEAVLFDGNGYRVAKGTEIEPTDDIGTSKIKLGFTFRTYDENSLIFLATIPEEQSFISLSLDEGRIVFQIRPVNATKVVAMRTQNGYNDGRLYNLQVSLELNKKKLWIRLDVSGDGKPEVVRNEIQVKDLPGIMWLIKPKKAVYHIGGVAPTFDAEPLPADLTLKSFLGSLQPHNSLFKNSAKTISHGTTAFDDKNELFLDKAWFNGDGYLKLNTSLESSSSFNMSFIFRVDRKLNPNNRYFLMELNKEVVILMENENIILRAGGNEFNATGLNWNDSINIFRMKYSQTNGERLLLFFINNNEQRSRNISLSLDESLEIYMGKDRTRQAFPFAGGISKMFVNDRAINFGTKEFSRVEIGREKNLQPNNSTREHMMNTEGCANVGLFATEPDAIKFGDKQESYVYIENLLWKKDYEIELSFRTFYPNGVLLVSAGSRDHYNLLEIKEGKIQLHFKGKTKKTIGFPEKINDGQWHNVRVVHKGVKKKRKVTIYLDDVGKKPTKPKNNVKGNVYIGGVPLNFTPNKELTDNILAFRGCMKDIKINGKPQISAKIKKNLFHNIGQCFPKIEEGAYFNGDAHAVYKRDFEINKILELNFEFRTSEWNGVLLSVSNAGNSPALSVELQNGAIVMTIDMGNGAVSNVTNNLNSEFGLCNNMWHNVTALYSSSELTVNVDGIRKSWVQSDVNSLMDEIEAPLYIGGIPVNAPVGTLKSRENFKGCIRKLSIEEKLMDWTDMEELNNVLLNSCPVT